MNLRPLGDRVIIEPITPEEKTKVGIILPDTASKEKPMEGKIVAVGKGSRDEKGNLVAMEVKAGDKVIFGKYSGTDVKIEEKEYLILRENDILAIVE